MDAPFDTWLRKDAEPAKENSDIVRASVHFGFDRPTAERLAFIRWLWRCGRLGDG